MADILRACSRALTASVLCVLMAEQPLMMEAATTKSHSVPAADPAGTIQGDDRILHALNRFTYGPRPGDVDAVKQMGLDKWFEQQLNPEKLDNSVLDQRMLQYPAMKMDQAELMSLFPNNQMIRAVSNGLMPMPTDPIKHAIYADQVYFYSQIKKGGVVSQKGAKKAPAPASPDNEMMTPIQKPEAAENEMTAAPSAMTPSEQGMEAGKKGKKSIAKASISKGGEGLSREDVQAILALPPEERFHKILSLEPPQLVFFRASARRDLGTVVQGMTPEQREILGALGSSRQVITGELYASNLLRDAYSTHQLQEVMTDFWLNHFNIYIKKNELTPYQLASYERQVIAPNALGHFEDLLVATAKSPAMLSYLDNYVSTGPKSDAATKPDRGRPGINPDSPRFANNPDAQAQIKLAQKTKKNSGLNENYARELMELHTLGVNGGYTQQDVTEVAKVFTGWSIDRPYRGGGFTFDARHHEPGTKAVLGTTIPEGGQAEGMAVLHMLATSPKTAHFISQELAVRFVADVPPASLVDRMAATFLATHGDMKEVLRTMYKSPEFWSKDVYRAKVKTPSEYVLSAVRASDVQMRSALPLEIALERLGQPLFGCQPPTGYYWRASDWVSTSALVSRMNFALALSANALPGITTDWSGMLNEDGIASTKPTAAGVLSPKEKEQHLEGLLMNRPVSEKTRQTVLDQAEAIKVEDAASKFPIDLGDLADLSGAEQQGGGKKGDNLQRLMERMPPNAVPADKQASVMAGLLIGSPEFQRR